MNQFYIISRKRFESDFGGECAYEDIKLPARATRGSAGYDFYAPYDFTLAPGQWTKIPTGIRIVLDDDKFLLIAPRSGLGFKYRLQLDNTVGIIDSDYCRSDNEGHIFIKMTNCGNLPLSLTSGSAFAQGIFCEYGITVDDNCSGERTGGFGSTDKK